MVSLRSLLISLFGLASFAAAKSSSGDSVLVVLDRTVAKEDYSLFFTGLEKRGYELTYRSPKDVTPAVIEDDIPSFAHVIIFAPESKTFASDITPQSLVTLLAGKTNLLLALGQKATPITSLATEFSLTLPPPGTPLISHFPKRDEPASEVLLTVPKSHPFLSADTVVYFSGVSHVIGNNPLLVPMLHAPPESFAAESTSDEGAEALVDAAEKGGEGLWAGSSMGVVTGFQTKDNARVTFVGGASLFSDVFARKELDGKKGSSNAQIARDIAAWTFQESLVFRIDSTEHHRVNQTGTPDVYTTNDEIVFTAHISKYDVRTTSWKPFSGIEDLQLEFTMLDPHIRTALKPIAGSPGTYSVTFRAPDRHGVFKFVIDYKRTGSSFLYSSTIVPVVPPRHDGYPRFLSAAWPYYAGAISTSVGFVVFSAMFLAGDVKEAKKRQGLKVE